MARRIRIKWGEGESVAGLLEVPQNPGPLGVLLAHGAGAGQEHPFMAALRRGLAAAGLTTLTFNYAYTEAARKAPDRMPKLLEVHAAAANRLQGYVDGVVLAGKSMGGRMGSHLAAERGWPARGVVYYGYPLVPLGKKEPRDTEHLHRITCPQLFLAGTRDPLGPLDAIRTLVDAIPTVTLHVIEGGNHSFDVPKAAGRPAEDVRHEMVAVTASWIDGLSRRRRG